MKETFASLPTPRKVSLVAAAVVLVALFLPWVSVLGISVSGISTGDGKLVLVVTLAALAVLAASSGLITAFTVSPRVANLGSGAAGAFCALVALVDLNDFAAFGLYLTLLASIAWVIAEVVTFRAGTVPAAESETPAG
jgi:hypothetical protein